MEEGGYIEMCEREQREEQSEKWHRRTRKQGELEWIRAEK